MQTPNLNNRPANLFQMPKRQSRLKTCSASRHSYKPSVVLADFLPKSRKQSSIKPKVLRGTNDEERKTFKKVCNNPINYFRTLRPERDFNGLDDYLCIEFFGSPVKNSALMASKMNDNESIEIVHLKNSSIHLSKVFSSDVLDATPQKPKKKAGNLLYGENNSNMNNTASDIHSIIMQLDKAIHTTELDPATRDKLIDSIKTMKSTLQQKREPLNRSFSKYLSNKRQNLIHRN